MGVGGVNESGMRALAYYITIRSEASDARPRLHILPTRATTQHASIHNKYSSTK